jgi:hypothetical protein
MPRDAAAALKGFKKWPGVRIEHGRGPVNARRNLLKQLQPFAPDRKLKGEEPGDVAARPREARDKARADRIGNVHEKDGDGARLFLQSRGGRCVLRQDEVGLKRDEFLGGLLD